MDCQGTGDKQKSSKRLDHMILFLGLRMANVQILNVKADVHNTDLERLEVNSNVKDIRCCYEQLLKTKLIANPLKKIFEIRRACKKVIIKSPNFNKQSQSQLNFF